MEQEEDEEQLTLELIAPLGGTKKDLKLLQSDQSVKDSDVSHKEIAKFIDGIGLTTVTLEAEEEEIVEVPDQTSQDSPKKIKKSKIGDKIVTKTKSLPSKNKKRNRNEAQEESYSDPSDKTPAVVGLNDIDIALKSITVKVRNKLLFNSSVMEGGWFDQAKSTGKASTPASPDVIEHLRSVAAQLMEKETSLYEEMRSTKRKADSEWLKTIMASGTISDKLSARTLLIQESPLHQLGIINGLLAMAKKKSKRESLLAVDALQDLWLTTLLPDDRKLKLLAQQPLKRLTECSSDAVRDRILICWYFEEQLKERYGSYITILQTLSHDTVMNIRTKIIGNLFDLLVQKPEQEQNLLTQLVNKLGDPERQVASRAAFFLLRLIGQHPNMQLIVLKEIERLLYRPNIQVKAQYYAVCCINQFILSKDNQELVNHLITIYFVFFKTYIQEDQLDAKMLSALLTGINRAFPFTNGELESFEEHLNTLFKVVHVSPITTSIHSLMLLYQVMESRQEVSDRFYRALYTKLLDIDLRHAKAQAMFLNVLFKSLKCDPSLTRVKAFLKRILQACSVHEPPYICGCLFLISELLKLKSTLWPFIREAEGDVENFKDVPLEEEDIDSCSQPDEEERDKIPESVQNTQTSYLPKARNPLYCKAEHSCLWEIVTLTQHYHPSVQAFAKKLAEGEHIIYKGDPLQDFTTAKFLDKFVYKNPKQKKSDRGGSIMQPTPKYSRKEIPLNSEEFIQLKQDEVREDEMFFYKYFTSKGSLRSISKKVKDKDLLGGDLDDDDNNDEQMDQNGDLDFARELNEKKKLPKKKKGKKGKISDSEESDYSTAEYSYSDLDEAGSEESLVMEDDTVKEPTEAEFEKMLFENLSSEESGRESEEIPKRKKSRSKAAVKSGGFDASTMLADAEEFAHLLEESSEGAAMSYLGKKHATQKQLQWEEKRTTGKRQTFKGKRSYKPRHQSRRSKKTINKKSKKRK